MELACVCTDKQVVIVGIAKEFSLDNYRHITGRAILGELFNLVGFKFISTAILTISGPSSPETASKKLKYITLDPAFIDIKTNFIKNYVRHNAPSEETGDISGIFQTNQFNNKYFDEIIEVVRGV